MQLHYKRSKKQQKLKQLVFLVNIATYRLLGRTQNKFSEMLTQFIVTILVFLRMETEVISDTKII